MPLPTAVRKRAEAAREQARRSKETPQSVAEKEPEQPSVEDAHPPDEPEAVATKPETREPERKPGFIDPSDWEGRYKALRSSRDERLKRAESANAELQREVEGLRQQLQRFTAQEKPETPRFEIDPSTRDAIGETEATVFDSLANTTDQRFEQLRAEQEKLREELRAREQRAMERFFDELTSIVPNWRDTNTDKGFLAWLAETDPSTGERRQSLLEGFVAEHNSEAAARLFLAYQQGSNPPSPQPVSPDVSPEPVVQRPQGASGAEEQLIEVYSPDEVKAFYERKSKLYRTGRLHGATLAEIQAEEAKIRKAISENRVF